MHPVMVGVPEPTELRDVFQHDTREQGDQDIPDTLCASHERSGASKSAKKRMKQKASRARRAAEDVVAHDFEVSKSDAQRGTGTDRVSGVSNQVSNDHSESDHTSQGVKNKESKGEAGPICLIGLSTGSVGLCRDRSSANVYRQQSQGPK